MQWLSLLVSFLAGKFNTSHRPSLADSAFAIIEQATYKSRKPVALVLGGLSCVLLLCGGFFMSLIDLTQQYDREGVLRFTASFMSGLVLIALAIAVFAWIFMSAWPGVRERVSEKPQTTSQAGSSLEQALALLVMDFVKEREHKRDHAPAESRPPKASTPLEKDSNSLYN